MTQALKFPSWVYTRVREMTNLLSNCTDLYIDSASAYSALAEMIHKYETPPVSKNLLLARKIYARYWPSLAKSIEKGDRDDVTLMRATVAVLNEELPDGR